MDQTRATILRDSVSSEGHRLTTYELTYPRFIHSELMTHRALSRNAASSRAIPTEINIKRVRTRPFVPGSFNQRVKGMGVGESFSGLRARVARWAWLAASKAAAAAAQFLNWLGLDKSRANRLLEPFLWMTTIVSATEWENFNALRNHEAAQPEFRRLAGMMREALDASAPEEIVCAPEYAEFEWHLPLVDEVVSEPVDWQLWKQVSTRRCARVSYDRHHDDEAPGVSAVRANELLRAGHLSPAEHVARPFTVGEWRAIRDLQEAARESSLPGWRMAQIVDQLEFCGNLRGWVSFRKGIEHEDRFDLMQAAIAGAEYPNG